jgi:hypothetical protein
MDTFADLYRNGSTPLIPRSADAFGALFAGWTFVEPGVSPLAGWHPSPDDPPTPDVNGHADALGYGAVAALR